MLIWNKYIAHTIFILIALCGMAGAKDEAQPQMPHWEALQKQFKGMLTPDAISAPFSRIDGLKQLLKKEKISDQELASAIVIFISQQEKIGEEDLLVIYSGMMAAHNSLELAEVWTTALGSKDEKIRRIAPTLLETLEHRQNEKADFELYTSLLARDIKNMPMALVQYMYGRDHNQAFSSLIRATRNDTREKRNESIQRERDLIFAHHMIEHAEWFLSNDYKEGRDEALKTAIEQLTKLTDAPEWWARLYVAKAIVGHQEFRSEAILKKMAEDKNEMVRKAVERIQPVKAP